MSGFEGERVTGPVASWRPFAFVTETTAKRGSTASSKVSAAAGGGLFRTTLADGTVRTR